MGLVPSEGTAALDKFQKVEMATRSGPGTESSGLVNTLQGHVDDIRTLIQCGICIRPLYEPFTIACGHTFCYSCLSSWFAGGRSKRTCPDCRAPVKTQPAPAYLVRAVVQMFTGRAELLDKGETTAEHKKNQKEEANKLDQDKANSHPTEGGLFGGLFKPKPPPLAPVIDVDDGVARCPHCAWELEDGENCAGCGYRYRPGSEGTDDSLSADYSESELDSDGLDEMDEDYYEDIENTDRVWGDRAMFLGAGESGPPHGFEDIENLLNRPELMPFDIQLQLQGLVPRRTTHGSEYDEEDEEDEDEENEYDEEDSFIDAENDHVPTSSFIEGDSHRLGSDEMYGSESDRSTGTVVEDVHHGGSDSPDGLNYRHTRHYFDDEASDDEEEDSDEDREEVAEDSDDEEVDEDSDESDEDAVRTTQPRRGYPSFGPRPTFQAPNNPPWLSARRSRVIPDSDDLTGLSEESDPSSPPRHARSIGRHSTHHGTTANTAITLDDSDEDQPVGPVRRAARRRQARFSPY